MSSVVNNSGMHGKIKILNNAWQPSVQNYYDEIARAKADDSVM